MDRLETPSGDPLALEPALTEATEWLLTLQRPDVSPEHIAAWQGWLGQHPRNRLAFDRLQAVQECIDAVEPVPWSTPTEIAADGYAGTVPVAEWLRNGRNAVRGGRIEARWHQARWRMTAAAALAGLAALLGHLLVGADDRIGTAVGELRRIQLEDGSSVTLGGRTEVTVDFDSGLRLVTLEHGEAFFEVAKDTQRPFVVHSSGSRIRAIGTAFNVRQSDGGLTVAVSEGTVEISRARGSDDADAGRGVTQLQAGERIRITAGHSAIPSPIPIAPQAVGAWREGERQYLGEPLSEVVADLARYSTRKIVIHDPSIGGLQVTGAVFEREMDQWLQSLRSALPVEVTAEPNGTVTIRARAQPARTGKPDSATPP
jgi:transmembrane sensor